MKQAHSKLSSGLRLMWLEACAALAVLTAGTLANVLPAFAPHALELLVLLTLAVTLAGFVGAAMGVAGLWKLRGEHRDYKITLAVSVVRFICAVVRPLNMRLKPALSLIIAVLALLEVYLVVRATNTFLDSAGREDLKTEGKRALWAWAIATLVSWASNAWVVLSSSRAGGWARVVITQAVIIVTEALYLVYLKHSSEALA